MIIKFPELGLVSVSEPSIQTRPYELKAAIHGQFYIMMFENSHSVAAKLLSLWLLQVQMAGTAAVVSRARFLTSLQIDNVNSTLTPPVKCHITDPIGLKFVV